MNVVWDEFLFLKKSANFSNLNFMQERLRRPTTPYFNEIGGQESSEQEIEKFESFNIIRNARM